MYLSQSASAAGTAARQKTFKKGVEPTEARRRRTETTIQIRKEKKEDQIQKRRMMNAPAGMQSGGFGGMNADGTMAAPSSSGAGKLETSPAQIMEHRANVFSDDLQKQLQSTQHFRRLLSIGAFDDRMYLFQEECAMCFCYLLR